MEIGQRVVCVPLVGPLKGPICCKLQTGRVYTIRDIDRRAEWRHGEPTIRLEEIVNDVILTVFGWWERGYTPRRFRPVKPTSIEIFERMLQRNDDREGRAADAERVA